jgi:uncharacterized membrane protein YqiK
MAITEKCKICGKTVYATEKLVTQELKQQTIYHKLCFKCSVCSIKLDVSSYGSSGGVIYCIPHLKQYGKPEQAKGASFFISPLANTDPNYVPTGIEVSSTPASSSSPFDESEGASSMTHSSVMQEDERRSPEEQERPSRDSREMPAQTGDSPTLSERERKKLERERQIEEQERAQEEELARKKEERERKLASSEGGSDEVGLDDDAERKRRREERQRQLEEDERRAEEERKKREKEREERKKRREEEAKREEEEMERKAAERRREREERRRQLEEEEAREQAERERKAEERRKQLESQP